MYSSAARALLLVLLVSGVTNSVWASGEATQPTTHRHKAHRHAHKATKAAPPTQVEVTNGTTTQTQFFDTSQPISSRHKKNAPAETRVAVLNGTRSETDVFASEHKPSKTSHVHAKAKPKADPNHIQIEIRNGGRTETKTFDKADIAAPAKTDPVVVGVASGDATTSNGSSQTMAIRVASSGSVNEQGNVQPAVVGIQSSVAGKDPGDVTNSTGRRSKRAPYRRATPQTP